MSEPWEWELADIERLIGDRVQESLVLDYKASAALSKDSKAITDLSKDVSAFANSEGGTLVYGVSQDDENYPREIDGGYDRSVISPEWIGQVVDSRISPTVRGYRIADIKLQSGKSLYLVYVPQSETAHMADDNRYYRRSDCRSVPMEDYEVRDVMGRSKTADLRLDFRLAGGGTKLFVYAENFSPVPVPYFVAYIYLGDGSGASHPSYPASLPTTSALLNESGPLRCDVFVVNWADSVPLMQGIQIQIPVGGTAISLSDLPGRDFFAWETITPGRVNREAYTRLIDAGPDAGQPIPLAREKWSIKRPGPDPRR
ncbi:MAG: AlbA family DNA-binding domain-containing protein [Acidimicrobiia bacterium]